MGLSLIAVFSPLVGAVLAFFTRGRCTNDWSHKVTIGGLSLSFSCALYVLYSVLCSSGTTSFAQDLYTWAVIGNVAINLGILIDPLSAIMMVVVTSISLAVHIYSTVYMHNDPGYPRFFMLISIFTSAMLILVTAHNVLQLFFAWELVGVISYLLIGFWFHKKSAVFANMKAFLINRIGDFGFLLGIVLLVVYTQSFDFATIFAKRDALGAVELALPWGGSCQLVTAIALLLFVGAMGKSAQCPLHIWLPDSMEGPTPVSALIHAATMVTAGIYMVARFSPLYDMSSVALSFLLFIGSVTIILTGILAIVQNDIKKVIAYSTLSQLGYMTVALGSSAYSIALFHLVTHAFFKALLFLSAGSVIMTQHHEQDIRRMGGLARTMPITAICFLFSSLALVGVPFFSGFYSKELILLATMHSSWPMASFAQYATFFGVFLTAWYSSRLYLQVFHGKPAHDKPASENASRMLSVLLILLVPSVMLGYFLLPFFLHSLPLASVLSDQHHTMVYLTGHIGSATEMGLHGFVNPAFLMLVAGIAMALIQRSCCSSSCYYFNNILINPVRRVLANGYYFDAFFIQGLFGGLKILGNFYQEWVEFIVDKKILMGLVNLLSSLAQTCKKSQTGLLYQYVFTILSFFITLISLINLGM